MFSILLLPSLSFAMALFSSRCASSAPLRRLSASSTCTAHQASQRLCTVGEGTYTDKRGDLGEVLQGVQLALVHAEELHLGEGLQVGLVLGADALHLRLVEDQVVKLLHKARETRLGQPL